MTKRIKRNNKRKRNTHFAKEQFLIKQGRKCHLCKVENLRTPCYVFHHINRNTKKFALSSGLRHKNLKAVQEEIKKCVVLCSNCHAGLHCVERTHPEITINLFDKGDIEWLLHKIYEYDETMKRAEAFEGKL